MACFILTQSKPGIGGNCFQNDSFIEVDLCGADDGDDTIAHGQVHGVVGADFVEPHDVFEVP